MANTEIHRGSDTSKILLDQNVSAERSFYTPYFDEDEPDVGENNPDKLGAIATNKNESGDVQLQVYQGGGVWKVAGGSTDIRRVFLIPSSAISSNAVSLNGRTNEEGDEVVPTDSVVTIYEGNFTSFARYNELTKSIDGLDGSLDVKIVLSGSVPPPESPNTIIVGMNFGSPAAFQTFLLTKGNTGAVVSDFYNSMDDQEAFKVTGINSLASNTFSGSDITFFNDMSGWLSNSIGSNCFASTPLTGFLAPALKTISIYAFDNCSDPSLVIVVPSVQNINPGAFRNATGLNGKQLSLPSLVSPNGLGGSPAYTNVFEGITSLTVKDVPIAFQTNNSGTPDGDLQEVTTNGGTVLYKQIVVTVITGGVTTSYFKDENFEITPGTTSLIFHDTGETLYWNANFEAPDGPISMLLGTDVAYGVNLFEDGVGLSDTNSVTEIPIY